MNFYLNNNIYPLNMCKKLIFIVLLSITWNVNAQEVNAGTPDDVKYAENIWQLMKDKRLVGNDRDYQAFPFYGERPHSPIQEVMKTTLIVNGKSSELVIKHNYGNDEDNKKTLALKEVYSNPKRYLKIVSIMLKQEKGYDSDHKDWFWAEYTPDGKVYNYQNQLLAGRHPVCTSCHGSIGGKDYEIETIE